MCFNTPFDAYQYSTASTPPHLNTGGAIYVNARRLGSTTNTNTTASTTTASSNHTSNTTASSLLSHASSFAAANNVTTGHSVSHSTAPQEQQQQQQQQMIIVSSAAPSCTNEYNTATATALNTMNLNTAAANSAVTAAMNEALQQQYGHAHVSSGASVASLPTIAQYSPNNPNSNCNSSTLSHPDAAAAAFYNTQGLSISRGLGVNTIRQSVAEQAHHQLRGVTTPRGTAQQQLALHHVNAGYDYANPSTTSTSATLTMNNCGAAGGGVSNGGGISINSGSAAAMFATAHRGVNVRSVANLAGFNGMVARGLSTTRVALNGGNLGLVDAMEHGAHPSSSFATTTNATAANNTNTTPPQFQLQLQQRSKVAGRTMMLGEMDDHKPDWNLNLNSNDANSNSSSNSNANNNNNNNNNKLSDLHSFVRQHCIEVFSCTAEDVEKHPRSKGTRRARLGQVGLRCVHCKHLPLRELANQSISFPTSTAHIYESVRNWHRFHFDLCRHIPRDIRQKYNALKRLERSSKTGRFATKEYFTESAKRMGMVDTRSGIFFSDDDVALRSIHLNLDNAHPLPVTNLAGDVKRLVSSVLERAMVAPHPNQLVLQEHRKYVTDCTWLLYCQLQTCLYKSNAGTTTTATAKFADNRAKHHGTKLLGLECRHCTAENKQDRHGRYYPSTEKKLSDASFSQCVYLHMIKCEMCPYEVKKALESLHTLNAMQRAQLKRGSKKRFFSIIWQKMQQPQHGIGIGSHNGSVCKPLTASNVIEAQQQQHVGALTGTMNAAAANASDLLPRLSHHPHPHHPHAAVHHTGQHQQQQQPYTPHYGGTQQQQSYHPTAHAAASLSGLHTHAHQAAAATTALIPRHAHAIVGNPHTANTAANNPHLNHHPVNVNHHHGVSAVGEDVVENGSAGSTPEEREDAKLIIQFATANC
eukprot:CAMPEP_0196826478 /NCGR_PEP_ID=MMETSP1362-20130617/93641_1 /TAXON_ID=163516 /ORGANISM="Leptocylindrus danicus, Strain CCMP1856" /LENGTH=925 /DNA_ID=CAMNT_0042207051 /DNA_START=80 /DNA_END=2857 /DNA_ORIENTATION=-